MVNYGDVRKQAKEAAEAIAKASGDIAKNINVSMPEKDLLVAMVVIDGMSTRLSKLVTTLTSPRK